MSMILDAMKRSKEGESRTSDVPTVDTVHYVPEPEPRFSTWQVGAMVAGALVVIAAILSVLWPSEPSLSLTPAAAEVAKTPISTSQVASGEAQRDEVSPSGAPSSVIPSASSSNPRQQSPAENSATRTSAFASNGSATTTPVSALTPTPVPTPAPTPAPAPTLTQEEGDRAAVTKSAPLSTPERAQVTGPSARASTRPSTKSSMRPSTRPATNADDLRAIYQALNEEASQSGAPDTSESASRVEAVAGLSGRSSAGRSASNLPGSPNTSGLAERVGEALRDNAAASASGTPVDTSPTDFADILAAAQEEMGVKPLVESSEPLLETLSQQIKDDIPSLIYSEHRYDPLGNSSVTLNGKVLKERQRAGAFTVIEILPDSVVLRWRETQFRVRARNSWVNM